VELVCERLRLFGRNVEAEQLHRHQAVSRRFVRAEHGTESANTNLMQDPERSERRRWSEGSRIVSGHSTAGIKKM
jgi:hypothetical protein